MHISSLLVYADPVRGSQLRIALASIPGVEVHAVKDDHAFVVTVETEVEQQTVDTFARIDRTDGVLSTSLVWHQMESEPEQEI